MKLLVLVANYPNNNGGVALMYTHVRNKYYVENGFDVTVLNFKAEEDYVIDGVKVISLKTYKESNNKKYDVLISHAANLRNHYLFIKKYEYNFNKFIFFFHGHEVLRINQVYPKSFDFYKKNFKSRWILQDLYDSIKFVLWRKYFLKLLDNAIFIFVSNYLFNQFKKNLKLSENELKDKFMVISNSVAKVFEERNYNFEINKEYDFITIRSNLDSPTYSIDLLNKIAKNNEELRFLLIGKGNIFNYIEKADNITWINEGFKHEDLIKYIDSAKCALMLTRNDTQGVMSCELATYGIPLITSNIEVCHEVLGKFDNVLMLNNEDKDIDLKEKLKELYTRNLTIKNEMYYCKNTIVKEVELCKSLLK